MLVVRGAKIERRPHRCWGVSTGDKCEPLAPASGDLKGIGYGKIGKEREREIMKSYS